MAPSWAACSLILATLLFGLLSDPIRAAEPASSPLVLERTIPLPGVSGRIDHMAVDLRRGRLFVAELGNGTIDVVDLAAGKAIHRIAGLREPQGVGYSPQMDVIAVASAGDGSVRLFKGEDFSPVGVVSLGDDADNVRLDTRTGQLVVGYGGGGLAVLDLPGRSVAGTSRLPAHPEGFQLDPSTRRAFVNVPDAGQVAVVDLAAGKLIASWRVPGLKANFPMAFDAAGAVLATVFRNPPRLALLDTTTGAVTANLQVCGDADDVFFDAKRRRIYVSCGEGLVDVLQGEAAGYHPLARIPTRSGARTSLFVPELDRLFVAARAGLLGSDAALLVFRPGP
jgi:DNA-binding beta-propeller fold protein YncE